MLSTNTQKHQKMDRVLIGVGDKDKSIKQFLGEQTTQFLREIEDCSIQICI